jgi:hypothetical protein
VTDWGGVLTGLVGLGAIVALVGYAVWVFWAETGER